MLSFDRETMTIVAIVVCIAATVYMYKEFSKTKHDIEGIKNFCNKLVQAHTPQPTHHKSQSKTLPVQEEDDDDDDEPTPVDAETEEN
jgi:hypothetical protein